MYVKCVSNVCLKRGAPADSSPNPCPTSAGEYNTKAVEAGSGPQQANSQAPPPRP